MLARIYKGLNQEVARELAIQHKVRNSKWFFKIKELHKEYLNLKTTLKAWLLLYSTRTQANLKINSEINRGNKRDKVIKYITVSKLQPKKKPASY
jgi:hypothetical protein